LLGLGAWLHREKIKKEVFPEGNPPLNIWQKAIKLKNYSLSFGTLIINF